MAIRAILWDYGSVLVKMVDAQPRRRLARQFGISYESLNRLVFDSDSARMGSLGEISVQQHWQAIGRILLAPHDQIAWMQEQFWSADGLDVALTGWIETLRAQGYKIGLISNAWDDLRWMLMERWKIAHLFDDLVISAEVGMVKPDSRIYALSLARLEVAPEEAVFFDDVLENVLAARLSGMQAFRYTDLQQAQRDLLTILS